MAFFCRVKTRRKPNYALMLKDRFGNVPIPRQRWIKVNELKFLKRLVARHLLLASDLLSLPLKVCHTARILKYSFIE